MSASIRRTFQPLAADPQAELVVLGGDDRWIVAADTTERLGEDHGVAAARFDLSDRDVPLEIGHAVVDRLIAIALAAPAEDHGDVGPLFQHRHGAVQPARHHLAVAVDNLDVFDARGDLLQPLEAGISRAGCRERARQVQLHDLRPQRPRQFDAAVRRIRIDVDDRQVAPDHRAQTPAQPLPFIAADRDDSQLTHDLCLPAIRAIHDRQSA